MNTDKSAILKALFENDINEFKSRNAVFDINKITEKIIGCSYNVSNNLGCGFLEKVYENSLAHELKKAGFRVL